MVKRHLPNYKAYAHLLERIEPEKTNRALRTVRLGNPTRQQYCPFCETETEHVAFMHKGIGSIGHRAIWGTLQHAFCCVQCDGGTKTC